MLLLIVKVGDILNTGEKIKQARKKAGITQKELGKKLKVSQAMIGQYESGKRKPKLETLDKIADALGADVWDLYEDFELKTVQHVHESEQEYTENLIKHYTLKCVEHTEITDNITFLDTMDKLGSLLNPVGQEKAIVYTSDLTKIPEYQKSPEGSGKGRKDPEED